MGIRDEDDEFRAVSPAAAMLKFEQAIEETLTPKAKPAAVDIDPEFAMLFKHFVALGCDRFPAMTPMEVCAAFVQLATAGLDRPLVETPVHVKVSPPYREPEPEYIFDRKIPHRIPVFVPPVPEIDDRNYNDNL